jgi:predicted O-methyltransferase YrrM
MSDTITFNTATQQIYGFRKSSGHGLGELVKTMKDPFVVEIGCSEGDTTEWLLQCNPTLRIVCIDPYVNYVDWNGNHLNDRQEFYEKTLRRLAPYGERFKMIRDFSDNVVDMFENESIDLLFIDGLHTYDQVAIDCDNYYPKVKTGGVFSGHDYRVIAGVHKAVNEFAGAKNKQILETECDVWYWYK